MISDREINNSVKDIYEKNSSLSLLLEFEEILDNLHIYAYENWFDGEVINGPVVSKYWVEVDLMYDYKRMPDPDAALRLQKYGCHVYFKKDSIEVNIEIESPDDLDMDSQGKRRPKTETLDVWVVKIVAPRHLLDEFNSNRVNINGIDINITNTAADDGNSGETQNNQPQDNNNGR